MDATTFNSTDLSASNSRVHATRPSGGVEYASLTNSASCPPSSLRYWRFADDLRTRTASNPSVTSRRRVRSTVRTPTSNASAMSASVHPGPCSPSSALSRMTARVRVVFDPFA